jgi:peptidoglycan/LPS O-acetylase OafA/YrhL
MKRPAPSFKVNGFSKTAPTEMIAWAPRAGQLVGEMGVVENQPRSATVRAASKVEAEFPLQKTSTTFADAFIASDNNFNLIRMIAASIVLFSHCFLLTGIPNREPFLKLGNYDTGGGWGVSIFFVISGFLVTRSALSHGTFDYLLSRIIRIVPALALVTIVTVFLIGSLETTETTSEYFLSKQTWRYLLNIDVFDLTYNLPGVFMSNPEAGIVNASLWTLPLECGFYIFLPLMVAVGAVKPRASLVALFVLIIVYSVIVFYFHIDSNNEGGVLFFRGASISNSSLFSVLFNRILLLDLA